jgi:hypothetical protein
VVEAIDEHLTGTKVSNSGNRMCLTAFCSSQVERKNSTKSIGWGARIRTWAPRSTYFPFVINELSEKSAKFTPFQISSLV